MTYPVVVDARIDGDERSFLKKMVLPAPVRTGEVIVLSGMPSIMEVRIDDIEYNEAEDDFVAFTVARGVLTFLGGHPIAKDDIEDVLEAGWQEWRAIIEAQPDDHPFRFIFFGR